MVFYIKDTQVGNFNSQHVAAEVNVDVLTHIVFQLRSSSVELELILPCYS